MTDLHMLTQVLLDFPDYPDTHGNHDVFKNLENRAAGANSRSKSGQCLLHMALDNTMSVLKRKDILSQESTDNE
jgi:hypothetical protein